MAGLLSSQQLVIGGVGDPGGARAVCHPAGPPSTGYYGADGVPAAVDDRHRVRPGLQGSPGRWQGGQATRQQRGRSGGTGHR